MREASERRTATIANPTLFLYHYSRYDKGSEYGSKELIFNNKTKKNIMRSIKITLLFLLISFFSFLIHARDFTYDSIVYTVLDENDKTCETKKGYFDGQYWLPFAGNKVEGDLTIPSVVTDGTHDYTVVGIGDYGFSYCTNLTSINLPDDVMSIGYEAFYACFSLNSIDIPNGVTLIGAYALSNCTGITSIDLPNGLKTIEE